MEREPEFETVEALVELLLDDDRDTATHAEVVKVAGRTRQKPSDVVAALTGYGVKYQAPACRRMSGLAA